jgi:hypothetical protein
MTRHPRQKDYHKAALIRDNGDVSALCFKRPRAIDLRLALWTTDDRAVTCPKCRALLESRPGRSPAATK